MPVGQKLEEARKRKGVSLREVSESTKIRGDYLSAIESGNLDINLPEVYLRGFVRLYAKFLGLDQDAMVSDLNNELGINNKNAKKSLGAIVSQENAEPKSGSHGSNPKSSNRSFGISQNHYLKPIIYSSFVLLFTVAVVVCIYLFSGDGSDPQNNSLESNIPTIAEKEQITLEKENYQNSHLLKISVTGDVGKLIICDEGKSPNIFHEFDSLVAGWEKEISFDGSFRCYSSNVENVVFAVDDGKPSKIGGNKSGIGTFNWKPQK